MLINLVRSLRNSCILLNSNISLKASRNNISIIPRRNVSKKINEEKYKLKDQLEGNYSLIYRAPMEFYLLTCAHVTSLTVIIIGSLGAIRYTDDKFMMSKEITYGGKLISNPNEFGFFIAGFLAINLALRVMVNRYPLRIYKQAERYTAVFASQMNPLKNVKLNFTSGQVGQVPISGILPWRECRYTINNKKVLFLVDYFKTPSELHKMMKIENSEKFD